MPLLAAPHHNREPAEPPNGTYSGCASFAPGRRPRFSRSWAGEAVGEARCHRGSSPTQRPGCQKLPTNSAEDPTRFIDKICVPEPQPPRRAATFPRPGDGKLDRKNRIEHIIGHRRDLSTRRPRGYDERLRRVKRFKGRDSVSQPNPSYRARTKWEGKETLRTRPTPGSHLSRLPSRKRALLTMAPIALLLTFSSQPSSS